MGATHRLLACRGCGSAIVEAAFALAGVPLEREEVDYSPGSPTRARLLAANPLGQVPVLLLPDGRVLTESLAILHYLDDLEPGARLVPPPGDALTAPPAQAAMLDPDPASPATSVTVRNGRGERVEILAQFGQFDTRLGSVAPHATATLRIPGRFVNWRGVVLVADFRDGLDLHTAPLRIAKHHHLGMILPAL